MTAPAVALAALDRRLDRNSPAPIAVAVSGGGDSMALLHMAADWAAEAERPLRVLTVDHGLNPDSGAWARFVREAAAGFDLSCEILRWTGAKTVTGLPAAARAARHALLAEAAREAGARVILMGHTADDLTEAGVMRAEGSTVGDPREWSPSPAWPEGRGVFLLRPLLALGRAGLREFLSRRGKGWIEDPANADVRFARARARLSDPSPLAGEGGARAPDEGAGAAAPRGSEPTASPGSEGHPLSAPPLATAHPSASRTPSPARGEGKVWGGLQFGIDELADRRGLSVAMLCAAGGAAPPRGRRLEGLVERLAMRKPVRTTLAGGRVVSNGAVALFGRDVGRAGLPSVAAEVGRELVWDGRFAVAPPEPGVVAPLAGRAARLSKAERASLKPFPSWARPTLPVLETASGAVRLLPEARPLALERLRAACGAYEREADLTPL